ncbi:hypothetical protein EUTSA_v10022171mg [Eutrema salsugineum]|uniref:RING-type E3 ubiquitin transferase n=1 Tax=Eutrema salsugineum TaxID=72664 RepID=V4NPT8_EUTSA|nr:hypothetical protein EUTSA_v10022171mg [Eutrema salsugineum]
MRDSVSEFLIQFGINFGLTVFFFGIVCGLVFCLIKCDCNDDNHHHNDHDNSHDHVIVTIMEHSGIKPSVLRSIPVVDFNSNDFKDGVECVVCLSDLVHGDKSRVLPSCNHWFHADCIDSWFRSHSTCPICRKRVCSVQRRTRPELGLDEGLAQDHDPSSEHPRFPTDPPPSTNAATVVEEAALNQTRFDQILRRWL